MNDPTRAPVKRYNWSANSMRALSPPGINLLWSTCHIEETTFKKSSLVKLYFCFFLFTTLPSLVNVYFIHYDSKRIELVLSQDVWRIRTDIVYFFSVSFSDLGAGRLFKSTKEPLRPRRCCSHCWFPALTESPIGRIRIPANERFYHFMARRQATWYSFIFLKSVFWIRSEAKK
jgi:hypothetical protein